MNNVFTAIQNRDGEALSRMSGYEHQYVNNDNVVNMSAERLVDALFKQLKQLFPAAVVTNLKTPEQEVAAKQQWIAAFAEGGIRTREQVSAGMRHARASESPFWPSPGQFIKWCKDSKMVLGVTIDDVMAEFHRYSKEKSLYPGGPERFPWRHPVMYWVVCDKASVMMRDERIQKRIAELMEERNKRMRVSADYVLMRLVEIDQMDVIDILNDDGSLKPIREWPKIWRTTLSGFDLSSTIMNMNEDSIETILKKIKWPDKVKNLELIGKHVDVNAFKERLDVNVNVTIADRIAAARKRLKERQDGNQ